MTHAGERSCVLIFLGIVARRLAADHQSAVTLEEAQGIFADHGGRSGEAVQKRG
jgi:hypothetical protein